MNIFPQALEDIIVQSVDEMLKATEGAFDYRLSGTDATSGRVIPVSVASVLGYSGDQMKGSLVVTCEKIFLEKSHPNLSIGMPVTDPDLLDWIGELTNQMLGRIKNKLAGSGVKFTMSTPTTVSGKSMQVNCPKDGFSLEKTYTGPHGQLVIHFLTVIDPSVSFKSQGIAPASSEGDSILF